MADLNILCFYNFLLSVPFHKAQIERADDREHFCRSHVVIDGASRPGAACTVDPVTELDPYVPACSQACKLRE